MVSFQRKIKRSEQNLIYCLSFRFILILFVILPNITKWNTNHLKTLHDRCRKLNTEKLIDNAIGI